MKLNENSFSYHDSNEQSMADAIQDIAKSRGYKVVFYRGIDSEVIDVNVRFEKILHCSRCGEEKNKELRDEDGMLWDASEMLCFSCEPESKVESIVKLYKDKDFKAMSTFIDEHFSNCYNEFISVSIRTFGKELTADVLLSHFEIKDGTQ
jgi:hypothetical protein